MSNFYDYYDADKFNLEETFEPHKPPKHSEEDPPFWFIGILFILTVIWNIRVCWKKFCKKEHTGIKLSKYRIMSAVSHIPRSLARMGSKGVRTLILKKFTLKFFSPKNNLI